MREGSDAIWIEGVEVSFELEREGVYRVLAGGREIGRVELVSGSTELVAYRAGGEAVKTWSVFGGPITARFGSREVAARALLRK